MHFIHRVPSARLIDHTLLLELGLGLDCRNIQSSRFLARCPVSCFLFPHSACLCLSVWLSIGPCVCKSARMSIPRNGVSSGHVQRTVRVMRAQRALCSERSERFGGGSKHHVTSNSLHYDAGITIFLSIMDYVIHRENRDVLAQQLVNIMLNWRNLLHRCQLLCWFPYDTVQKL